MLLNVAAPVGAYGRAISMMVYAALRGGSADENTYVNACAVRHVGVS